MVDAHGELIYVGKAKSLRLRLLSYFRPKSRDPKAGRILEQTRRILWEIGPSEFAALLRELELIRRWQPCFNVQGQPRRRKRTFVCVGRRPAPYVYLSARPPAGVLACFGPVMRGSTAREAVRRLNDWFGLRDCPQKQEMIFADQGELFPMLRTPGCLRHEIGTCLGPCAAVCTRQSYAERVDAARAFLEGTNPVPLDTLQNEMTTAAAALDYERAALLRDKHAVLSWLHGHLERLRHARDRHSFVYPVTGHDGREVWYLIRRGVAAAALPAPRETAEMKRAEAEMARVFGAAPPWTGATPAEEIDGVLLVATWFRKHAAERERVLEPGRALESCGVLPQVLSSH
jgi:excinuclease ABC subunit C